LPADLLLNPGASSEAIQHHYDISNDFYRLWLDATLSYSGAMWAEGDTLERAQIRKLEHHIEQARAHGARRILDVGCGWGGILRRLVENHGVAHAVGLTLSEAQAEWVRSFNDPRIEVRVESWSEHRPPEPYDGIISIGAFEHFARLESSDEEKITGYRYFFQHCHEWLKPGGRLSLQTFAYGNARNREDVRNLAGTQFLAKEIFPETDPPHLADIAKAIGGSFEIETLRNDRRDYARTCKEWLKNLRSKRKEAVNLVGEQRVAMYERYLQLSAIGFATANLDLYRLTLCRIDTALK
jgi:cyclopropane-fatty-acyl-phospholipid synthase